MPVSPLLGGGYMEQTTDSYYPADELQDVHFRFLRTAENDPMTAALTDCYRGFSRSVQRR